MKDTVYDKLSRREREMMDLLYARGRATAAEVRESMASPPSYSAVRATLRVLEDKGFVRHEVERGTYVFVPTIPRTNVSRSALKRVVATFFDDSLEQTVAALLDVKGTKLPAEERERLMKLIRRAEEEQR